MKQFDDILKNARQKASGHRSKRDQWQEALSALMAALLLVNKQYGDDGAHHIAIEHRKCVTCGKAMFILLAKDISDDKKLMKFHTSGCKAINNIDYNCEVCAKK